MTSRPGRSARIGPFFAGVLRAAHEGEAWGFERLYQAFAPSVAGYLRMQGASDPDDLTNEVFFNAFSALDGFDGDEADFRSWLFTIAHRRLTDDRRHQGRRVPTVEPGDGLGSEPTGHGASIEDQVLARLSSERVRALCERLAPDQRDVLLLRMVSGMSLEEVAATLGKSVTAVKALQRRALGAVRRIFDREGVSL